MNSMENPLTLPSRGRRPSQAAQCRGGSGAARRNRTRSLEVRLPDGASAFGQARSDRGAAVEVARLVGVRRILERGDVGFAEAWIDGDWHSPDLTGLLTLLANNRQALARAVYGQWWAC
jgi:cyclopropane-fatty-acyl-phospholipid synthase